MRSVIITTGLVLLSITGYAQHPLRPQQAPQVLQAIVVDGDTLPVIKLKETVVFAAFVPRTAKQRRRFTKLERNVRKTFPYARTASALVLEYEHDLGRIDKNNDQEKYIKLAEKELKAEFDTDIREMTMSQGRVLIKLIDRETGHTSYELIQQLRGGFQAFVWQGVAKLFGTDLKDEYDAAVEDRMIETIVRRIENGELSIAKRPARTAKAQAKLDKRKERLYRKYGLDAQETSLN